VSKKLKGASYEITHVSSKKTTSIHAVYIRPIPPSLQSFVPLNGMGSKYGQQDCPINSDTYELEDIESLLPHNPFKDFSKNSYLTLMQCMWRHLFFLDHVPWVFHSLPYPSWLSSMGGYVRIRIISGQKTPRRLRCFHLAPHI
jgi:hypothetical protein